jgi:cysteine-rich repeat protein
MHNMRSLLIALTAAIAIPACTQDITGSGPGPTGGDDDQQQPTCGNGTVDTGETCDDSNTNNGDGCSSSCQTENTVTPRVVLSVDNMAATTDLNVVSQFTVTATSMMGFTGDVTLNIAADSADWMASLDTTTLTLAADGSATAKLSVNAMGDTAMLAGNVKITATDTGPVSDVTVAMTFNPTLVVTFVDSGGAVATYDPAWLNKPYNLKAGRSIKVVNGSATAPMTVHVDNGLSGFPHEPGTTPAGGAYMGTTTAADANVGVGFYTHNGGTPPAFLYDQGAPKRPALNIVP